MEKEAVALIFGAMHSSQWDYLKRHCPSPDLVICADGGRTCAQAAGYTPDLLIGDWDSGGGPDPNIPSMTLPAEKDITDLQAAAEEALKQGYKHLLFCACTGGRLDQTLASLQLLEWVHDQGAEAILLDEGNEARFWDGSPLYLDRDETYYFLSILPLDREITGLTLQGVKYPLDRAFVIRGGGLTISNEITAPQAVLSAESGRMLVIRSCRTVTKAS